MNTQSNPLLGIPIYAGSQVILNGSIGTIKVCEPVNDLILFIEDVSKKLIQLSVVEVQNAYKKDHLKVVSSIHRTSDGVKASATLRTEIKRREMYCLPLKNERFPTSKKLLAEHIPAVFAKDNYSKSPPGISTVQKWYADWRDADFDMTLAVLDANQGRKNNRLPKDIEQVIVDAIEEVYLSQKLKPKAVIKKVFEKLQALGYSSHQIPCDKTIYNRLKNLDRLKAIKARDGYFAYREANRGTYQHHPKYIIMERVEADVLHVNIGVLDDEGRFLGSLSIVIYLDCGTRIIVGFALMISRKKKEDSSFVLAGLMHSLKQTDEYPYSGVAHQYVLDGGPGFKENYFNNLIRNVLQSDVLYTKTRQGWDKPFVESLIKTLREYFGEEIDGYIGKYDSDKYPQDTLMKSAKYSVTELEKKLTHIFADLYPHNKLEGLKNKTPHQEWVEQSQKYPVIVPQQLPASAELRPISKTMTLHHVKGVTYQYQWFNSKELQTLYHRLHKNTRKQRVQLTIQVNDYDASGLNVVDPDTGIILEVPNIEYPNTRVSFIELNGWRSKENKVLGAATRIDNDDPVTPRKAPNRRGPSTNLIALEEPVTFDMIVNNENEPTPNPIPQEKKQSSKRKLEVKPESQSSRFAQDYPDSEEDEGGFDVE